MLSPRSARDSDDDVGSLGQFDVALRAVIRWVRLRVERPRSVTRRAGTAPNPLRSSLGEIDRHGRCDAGDDADHEPINQQPYNEATMPIDEKGDFQHCGKNRDGPSSVRTLVGGAPIND